MRSFSYISFLIALLFLAGCEREKDLNPASFTRFYGDEFFDIAHGMIECADGNLAVAGVFSHTSTNQDMLLMKLRPNGDTVWARKFGGPNIDQGHNVLELADGSLVLVGTRAKDAIASDFDLYVVKVDADGNFISEDVVGGPGNDQARGICPSHSNGFVVTGFNGSQGNAAGMLWVREYTDDLSFVNETFIGNTGENRGWSIVATPDNGYAVAGFTNALSSANDFDALVLKFDENLQTIWTQVGEHPGEDFAHGIVNTSDGGIAWVGFQIGFAEFFEIAIQRLTAAGDTIQTKVFQFDDNDRTLAYNFAQMPDGGFAIPGQTQSFGNGGDDFFLLITDDQLDLKNGPNGSVFGGSNDDRGMSLVRLSDGSLVMAGFTKSFALTGEFDIAIVKTDADGNLID